MESLEAVAEEKTESKNPKKANTADYADSDQKRAYSAKLLKSELNSMLQKSPSHVHLNKVVPNVTLFWFTLRGN